MNARLARIRQMEPCPRCGYAVLSVQARLRETLAVIRRELPPAEAEALIDELAPIWTRP